MSNIIHLKDYSEIYEQKHRNYPFIKGYATNSRMMGVIGLRLHFQGLTLFYHLDFEEYGFDRFEAYAGEDPETLDRLTQSFIGGLGAELVEINLEEASALVYEAVEKGDLFFYDIPMEFFEYEYLLDEFAQKPSNACYDKITCDFKNDYERINYFMMRTAGQDFDYRDKMLAGHPIDFSLVEEPTLLLKNTITEEKGHYLCNAIIDYRDGYMMIICQIDIKDKIISGAEVISSMVLSAREASFQLNKTELILVCYTDHVEAIKLKLESEKPSAMKNIYEGGSLYTLYQPNNHHVRKQTYYLNEDVFAIIYITDTHQIVISAFDERSISDIKALITEDFPEIDVMMELEAETPILYSFVNTGKQDFIAFIGE